VVGKSANTAPVWPKVCAPRQERTARSPLIAETPFGGNAAWCHSLLNPCQDGRLQRSDLPMELVSPMTGRAVAATTAAINT